MRVFIHYAQVHALGALVQRTCCCTFQLAASIQARMHACVHVRTPVGRLGLLARKRAFVQVSHVYMHVRSHAHILCWHTNMRARSHVVLHACTHVPVLHVFWHSVVRDVHDRSNSFRTADSSHNVQTWHVTCFHSHRHTHRRTCMQVRSHAHTPARPHPCAYACARTRIFACNSARMLHRFQLRPAVLHKGVLQGSLVAAPWTGYSNSAVMGLKVVAMS